MKTRENPIPALMARYSPLIRDEAALRFGFDATPLLELEGTAFVYEGRREGQPAILKVTPGLRRPCRVMGASLAELEAEVDYIRYLGEAGVPVARSLPSLGGLDIEEIGLDEETSFLAYCFEKAPGSMFPDEDEVSFPAGVIREWGRLLGMTHRLSPGYRPRPGAFRKSWREDDCLVPGELVPVEEEAVHRRFDEILALLSEMPSSQDRFGIVHGDFHHGNFLAAGDHLTIIDFDAARDWWFTGDIATALFNCLPMPRENIGGRRTFALSFLEILMDGYADEFEIPPGFAADLPDFLYACELSAYAYRHKNWSPPELARRTAYLASIRHRIEERTAVVDFRPGDLESLGGSGRRPGTPP